MKKLHSIIIGSVIIISMLGSILFFNVKIGGDRLDDKIKHVKIVKDETGKNILSIEYGMYVFEKAKYRVRIMDEGDVLLLPDGLLPDNGGSLGDYRIEIMFIDVERSEQLNNEYPSKTVHKLKDVPIEYNDKFNIRIVQPPDDSMFIIYIGSDDPIKVKEHNVTKFDSKRNSIDIAFES